MPELWEDIADWFYVPYWKPSVLPATAEELEASWLLFTDSCGVAPQFIEKLKNQQVITVKIGATFSKLSEHDYTLNPRHAEDYKRLIKELHTRLPQNIVHLWSVTPNKELTLERLETAQDIGFYSLLFLAQALLHVTDEIQITVVSNTIQSVTGEERLSPEKSTVLGPVKVIGQEYPNLKCRHIDIVICEKNLLGLFKPDPILINQLFTELTSKTAEQLIAYRGKHRWVQSFEPVRLDKPVELRKKGVYLITGGLGGIGLVLAEHLAKTVQAKLILIGRSTFPAREEWHKIHDESVRHKIKKVQALEALGAEVFVASADVANLQQMQQVIITTEKRFGHINGVIHAAGIPAGGVIQQKTVEIANRVMAPKVKGTVVLDLIFKKKDLDFLILCSSLNSVLGGFGQVDYCGANAFLDAFSHQGKKVICINWDAWQEVGMAATLPTELKKWPTQGISPKEGIEVFNRVLKNPLSQVLVSSHDFLALLDQHLFEIQRFIENIEEINLSKPIHARPQLTNPYVAPRNPFEQKLAEIWQKSLGIEKIGIHDDFFELGGDSLLAVQLIAQLRKDFKTDFPVQSLLNVPTVAGLAEFIEQKISCETTRQPLPPFLIELKMGNPQKTPLFLIHALGGHIYLYRDLVKNLPSDQPIYGIQAKGFDGDSELLTQVEEMASYYIEGIRLVQPKGPYFLGGICFGGLLSFEVAQQLHKQGQKVALLALMDSQLAGQLPAKKSEGKRTSQTKILLAKLALSLFLFLPNQFRRFLFNFISDAEIIAYLLDMGANVPVSLKELRKLEPDEQLRYFMTEAKKSENPMVPNSLAEITQLRHFFQIYKINMQALWDYKMQVYSGKIIYFRAMDKAAYVATEVGWEKWADGGLELIDVPGNHLTLIDSPHVEVITERLKTEFE